MKKLLSVILSVFMVCTFVFIAGCDKKEELSRNELAQLYKTIAKNSWEQLGAGDPTQEETTLSLKIKGITVTDETQLAAEEDVKYIKANGASTIALVNMVGEFYDREDFILNDKVSTVSVTNPENQNDVAKISIFATLDKENNYVYIEMGLESQGVKACNFFEIKYNFSENKLISYRLIHCGDGSFNDQQNREDGGVYFTNPANASEKVLAEADAMFNAFQARIAEGNECSGDFTQEFFRYSEYSQKAFMAIMNANS